MANRRVSRLLALLVPPVAALLILATGTASFAGTASASDARPGGKLFVGGSFSSVNGTTATRLAAWDGVDWSALAGPNGEGADSTVTAMTMYNGKLIVGGNFIEAGGEVVSGIASWDGTTWAPLVGASGVRGVTVAPLGFVSALAVYNGDLYVGGLFPRAGGTTTVNNIARWDGQEWHALAGPSGVGTENNGSVIAPVWDMAIVDGKLTIAGQFGSVGGVAANSVASWDGSSWSSAGQPIENVTVLALTAFNGRIIASRYYSEDGAVGIHDVARLDAGQWSVIGTANNDVRDLTVYNGILVAGGFFTEISGLTVNHVAAWNGNAWSALSGPAGAGPDDVVYALAAHQGFLIVGGIFTQAGGVPAVGIARWNGAAWSALPGTGGAGVNDSVLVLLST